MSQILKFPDIASRRSRDRAPDGMAIEMPTWRIPVMTGDQWNEFIRLLTPVERQAFMADVFKVMTQHLQRIAVDLENGQLAVVASTEQLDTGPVREKDAKSGRARTIALPNLAIEELRRWRAVQGEELLRLGIRADDSVHVVTKADGEPIQPRSLTHAMSRFLKEWDVTLHKLRHSHASHMLASNIHPKIVQERLGYSSIAITMDIYSHLMRNMQGEAAAAVDAAMRGALKKPSE
jgi:integrase